MPVVFQKCFDKQLLVGGASADRFAVYSVDDHIVLLQLFRSLTAHNVENHLFGEFVILDAVLFQLLDFLFKASGLFGVADEFDYLSASGHAQLGEEIAYKLHIAIVYAIEAYRVDIVNYYYAFNHPLNK